MDRQDAIRLLQSGEAGIAEWNEQRRGPEALPDLGNAALEGAELSGANLSGANLSEANFSTAQLSHALLVKANLRHTRFDRADLSRAVLTGAQVEQANLANANLDMADLTGARMDDADLTGASLIETKLEAVNLSGASFPESDRFKPSNATASILTDAQLRGYDLEGLTFNKSNLQRADLSFAVARRATLEGTQLSKANLRSVDLTDGRLIGASLDQAELQDATLVRAGLERADFQQADLTGANLQGANLRGVRLGGAKLVNTNLLDVEVDSITDFKSARVDGCTVYRHTLESLDNYGGLAPGDRMRMRIVDGLATLRASYSGFMQWTHLLAVCMFVFPYAWFIVRQWGAARFAIGASETMPLWKAILRFVWNGGVAWEAGWDLNLLSFGTFAFALLYTALRLGLLWRTKTLELKEQASGLPVVFSLRGWWGRLYGASQWGFWMNLVFVLAHTWHFLTQGIPMEGPDLPHGL